MSTYDKYGPLDNPHADAGDVGFVRWVNRLRPDQLKAGEVYNSVNGRMDIDGSWQVRRGVEAYGPTLTASTTALQLQDPPIWKLYDGTNVIDATGASRVDDVVTVNTTGAHGYTSNTLVCIGGLTGTVDPNGNRLITVTDTDTFTFTITGATGSETYTGPGTAEPAELSATSTLGIYGSCLYSDPSASVRTSDYLVRAANDKAYAVKLTDGTSIEIEYPAGETVTGRCELLQVFDKVLLMQAGKTAWEWDGDPTGSLAFVKVSEGVYTQPTYYNATNNTSIADGVVTVTEAAHGLSVGDKISVVNNGNSTLIEGQEYTVAEVPTTGSFRFYAQVPDDATDSCVFTKKISAGKGYIHMPAPGWGVYHQRRLWTPYSYEPSASGPVARNVVDEIIASDILDYNTFDRIQNQFRVTAGVADNLVGALPFAEDNLLVFNNHSIHLITGISGNIEDAQVNLVTSEIGCVARRTILQVGNEVLFLSDNGVYAAAFGDLYNLRGAGVPMSEPIKATMDRINREYVDDAVAAYYANRYYLAVPLDDSTVNNALLIYNFLNKGWESLDTNQAGWDIQNLIHADNGGLGRLFTVSSQGAIHELDAREDGNDRISVYAGVSASTYPIESTVTTRQYTMGDLGRKAFSTYELHIESSDSESSNGSIGIVTENYDSESTLTTISTLNGGNLAVREDASLRGRIGNKRAYGLQMVLTPSNGRPKLRAVKVDATQTNRAVSQAT